VFRCRGKTILVSAAAFAGNRHSLDIRYVVAAAAGGAIIGDNIGFWVGREFGTSLLARWGYLIGLDERKRKLGQYLFTRHGGKIVLLRTFRRFAACLCGTAGWRKQVVSFAVSHLQCGGGNCLGDSVRSWRIRTWRRYSSNRRTIWMGGALWGDSFCLPSFGATTRK